MKKFLYAAVILLALAATWFQLRFQRGPAAQNGGGIHASELNRPVPDFHLVGSDSKPVALSDLKGKVWLASFIYTNCPGPCPLISRNLAAMQEAIFALQDTRIVTFTLDPARDTPEVLHKYADERHAANERWLFLTGSTAEVEQVVVQGFLVPRSDRPGEQMIHGTQLVLVDRAGNMRFLYEGLKPEEKPRILADMTRLLKE